MTTIMYNEKWKRTLRYRMKLIKQWGGDGPDEFKRIYETKDPSQNDFKREKIN